MTDIVNLAQEVKDMALFQSSVAWDSESFTFEFQQEYIQVLFDKASYLQSLLSEIEFKAEFR
jgi:hypothetical protein